MKFKDWIAKYEQLDEPIGDLAKDIARDKSFPDTNDCEVLLGYLRNKSACYEAADVFEKAWRRYITAVFKAWKD